MAKRPKIRTGILYNYNIYSSNRQNGYRESINFYFTYLFFYTHSNRFSIWIEYYFSISFYYFLLFFFSLPSLTLPLPLHLTQAKPRYNWWPLLLPMLTFTLSFISHCSLSLLHSISHPHINSFRFQGFLFLIFIFFHFLLIFFFHLFYAIGSIYNCKRLSMRPTCPNCKDSNQTFKVGSRGRGRQEVKHLPFVIKEKFVCTFVHNFSGHIPSGKKIRKRHRIITGEWGDYCGLPDKVW